MIEKIETNNAPQPVGPYSQAVEINNIVYVSGQIGLGPDYMSIVNLQVEEQTRNVLRNIDEIIKSVGLSCESIVRCEIFLTNIDDFEIVNKVYSDYFRDVEVLPARFAVGVNDLPKNAKVEIACIAHRNEESRQ